MRPQQLKRPILVCGRDDTGEAAAHVEHFAHLLVGDISELLDQVEDRQHRERVVDLVTDVGLEPQQVVESLAGDVREAAHVDLGAEELENGPHVDLRRLQEHVAQRAPEPLIVEGDIGEQTKRCLENLAIVAAAAGASLDDAVRCGIYVTDMSTFGAVNEAYGSFFGDAPPARSTIGVASLPLGADVEIDAILATPE